jgi:hypothetical protein
MGPLRLRNATRGRRRSRGRGRSSGRAGSRTARPRSMPRVHPVGEDLGAGLLEGLAGCGERLGPVRIQALEGPDQPTVLALVRVGTGFALVDQLAADRSLLHRRRAEATDDVAEVAPGEENQRHDHERSQPATDGESASADPAAARIADPPRVEVDIRSEGHSPSHLAIAVPAGSEVLARSTRPGARQASRRPPGSAIRCRRACPRTARTAAPARRSRALRAR